MLLDTYTILEALERLGWLVVGSAVFLACVLWVAMRKH